MSNSLTPDRALRAKLLSAIVQEELGVAQITTTIPRRNQCTSPVSFSQSLLWFLDQFEPGSPLYNIPSALRLTGQLDDRALNRSLQEIVRRHEILRTTFALENGSPVQRVLSATAY